MGLELPVVSAVMARLPQPEVSLAAYGGLVFPTALLIESPIIMLLASPAIAIMVQRGGPQPAAAQARLLAAQVEQTWHEVTPQPLRFVGGDAEIAYDVIAAAVDRPRALPDMAQPSAAELARSGMALVCFAEDLGCVHAAEARAPNGRRIESEITRNYWGIAGKPQRYTIFIVPPRP